MTARRGGILFVAAILLALVVAHLVRDTPGFVVREPDGRLQGDITHYVYWTRLVTLGGVQDAYSGTWPESYAVYPPVTLYGLQVVGALYRLVVDPSFDLERAQQSVWLLRAIKAAAVAWHLLAAAAIYLVVRRLRGPGLAGVAGALYVANPAALFDVAHWAQPDGAHSLFSVLAVGWLSLGEAQQAARQPASSSVAGVAARDSVRTTGRSDRAGAPRLVAGWWRARAATSANLRRWGPACLAWAAMAMAALAKPQAWALLPLVALGTWRFGGWRGLALGLAAGAGAAGLVLLPFLATGRLGEFLSLPRTISSVMPSISANAHNLWWLVLTRRGIDPLFTDDSTPLLGAITYREVAAVLVGAQLLFTWWLYGTRRVRLAEASALGALGWFVFTTQAHENHLFFVLPLLSLAWPERPPLLVPFALLSVTLLLNMGLHDQVLLDVLGVDPFSPIVARLRWLNAAANVLVYAAWSVAAARRPGLARQQEGAMKARVHVAPAPELGVEWPRPRK